MKQYKVGLVGIGAVGTEMVKVLRGRDFPAGEIRILARSERDEEVAGETFHVVPAESPDAFDGLDFALFAGTEGAKGASQQYGWAAVEKGAIVIDNGDDFRMDDRVPLVIPEINADALKDHQGFIANPNCSTIIALMAVGPLHRAFGVKRFIATTYQSVSGTGRNAIIELEQQIQDYVAGNALKNDAYPHQIAFNVLPQIGSLKDTMPGYTSEEAKMLFESRKILGDDSLRVSGTCVRVPVFYGHSEAINLEFAQPVTPERRRITGQVRRIVSTAARRADSRTRDNPAGKDREEREIRGADGDAGGDGTAHVREHPAAAETVAAEIIHGRCG